MEIYTPCPHALPALQAITAGLGCLGVAAVLLLAGKAALWCAAGVGGAAVLVCIWLPPRIRRLRCTLTGSHVTVRSGLLWKRQSSMALRNVRSVRLIEGPLGGRWGLNLVILSGLGGSLGIPLLSRSDCRSLLLALERRGVGYVS